jgi:hypothetical protein
MEIGLFHLDSYLDKKGSIIEPKVDSAIGGDLGNYFMLYYYRNPLNGIFFNESIILASMHSFGIVSEWQQGIDLDLLFQRSCYLSDLLKYEEFIQFRIQKNDR